VRRNGGAIMPKVTKRKAQKKRPAKAEQLTRRDDRAEASSRLPKPSTPNPATERSSLKAAFDAIHAYAMDALESKDYMAMGDAIEKESAIIAKQKALIERTLRPVTKRRK
jgi:hypothetical protein